MSSRMPALFIGHGSPMNAITDNPFRALWRELGSTLPRPHAVLCVSAHWETTSPMVCTADPPKTIHDFGGFPPALSAVRYPAPGSPALAERIQALTDGEVSLNPGWGLDHGAWQVLMHLFPAADVPVVQLSLARSYTAAQHLDLARKLSVLREEGVLILGSGNIVHNLRQIGGSGTPVWAIDFDAAVAKTIENKDLQALADYSTLPGAALAVPTPEHYWPLLYVLATRHADDSLLFLSERFDLGSISMRSVCLG
jgi:4,5-DOPA dioxygenase extradiol